MGLVAPAERRSLRLCAGAVSAEEEKKIMKNCIHAKCATRSALSLPCSSPEEHARLAQEAGDLYRAGKPQEAARRLGYAGIERVTRCQPDPDGQPALVAGAHERGQSAGAYALAAPLPLDWIRGER